MAADRHRPARPWHRACGMRPAQARRSAASREARGRARRPTRSQRCPAPIARRRPAVDLRIARRAASGRREDQDYERDRAREGAEHEPHGGIPRAARRVPPRQRRPYAGQQDQHDGDAIENALHASLRCRRTDRGHATRGPTKTGDEVMSRGSATPPIGAAAHRKKRLQYHACVIRPVIASVNERSGAYDRVLAAGTFRSAKRRCHRVRIGLMSVRRSSLGRFVVAGKPEHRGFGTKGENSECV